MKKFLSLLAFALVIGLFSAGGKATADVNDFVINKFVSDQELTSNDPQGQLHIVETIDLTFNSYNHGILRAIPDRYKNHSLQLHVNQIKMETGAIVGYTTYGSNGNTVLKIGDPNNTITGTHRYTIDYTLHNVISFYKDHDELYWDVNGDQWGQPMTSVVVNLKLPNGLKQTRQPICFAGAYGSKTTDCTINTEGDSISAQTTRPLTAKEALTYVASFETGFFKKPSPYETGMEYARPVALFLVPVLFIGGFSAGYWLVKGRDPKGRGVIVPEYAPPDGLKPMEVGTIADFGLQNKEITAAIIDLAIRKYIRIIETKKVKKMMPDTTSYQLQLLNTDYSALDVNETKIMSAIFSVPSKDEIVDLADLKNQLYKTSQDLAKAVDTELTTLGYFRSNPMNAGKFTKYAYLSVLVVVLFVGWKALGAPLSAGLIVGAAVAYFATKYMPARTAKGVAAEEGIKGLKMYLEFAEKDRIQKLQSPDAAYAANAAEPVKTVELFEKLLPYAMVLGVEKQWAGKFEGLYTSPPGWYSGNWNTFNAVYLTDSLNKGVGSAVNTAFTAPASSSSSGFGGGGFSGGGGGGGGGGGW